VAIFSKAEQNYARGVAHEGEDKYHSRMYEKFNANADRAASAGTLADPHTSRAHTFDQKMAEWDRKTGMSTLKKLLESQDYSSGYDPLDRWTGGDY
jgi:hypothetical protein